MFGVTFSFFDLKNFYETSILFFYMVFGSEGFVAWFEAIVYTRVRKLCRNIFIKIFVHSLGLLSMIIGIYFFITKMLSIISCLGVLLIFIGFIIFLTPLGVENEN